MHDLVSFMTSEEIGHLGYIAVLKPQKALKQLETAIEIAQENGSQFPRNFEQENPPQ